MIFKTKKRESLPKEVKDQLKKDFIEKLDEGQRNLIRVMEKQKEGMKKLKTITGISLLLGVCFLCSTIGIVFFTLPVPSGMEIWILRGLTGVCLIALIGQNLMDGPFIRSFRIGKMTGKTLVLIQRADNKWGWIFDNVRGGGVTSDIYGEFAVTKESMAVLDGVACGVADDSEGLTLPLALTKIAQELKVEGIGEIGTLDSLYNVESKIAEYENIQSGFKKDLEELTDKLTGDDKKDVAILEKIQTYNTALENMSNALEYLDTIKVNYPGLISLNKKTLILKPFLDFFGTYANNPIFKRTSRERAIAIEKAKAGKGENMGKIAFYLCMVVLAIGLCIYLIKTGTGESVIESTRSVAPNINMPQGIS